MVIGSTPYNFKKGIASAPEPGAVIKSASLAFLSKVKLNIVIKIINAIGRNLGNSQLAIGKTACLVRDKAGGW